MFERLNTLASGNIYHVIYINRPKSIEKRGQKRIRINWSFIIQDKLGPFECLCYLSLLAIISYM